MRDIGFAWPEVALQMIFFVREVHQLIPCFRPGDAMSQTAVAWQRALRHLGLWGRIYADDVLPAHQSLVLPMSRFKPSHDALVLYHHGIASPLAGQLLHLGCRKGVVYHNVTPARFYAGQRIYESLIAGRAQMSALASAVDLSIGVSQYNAAELAASGHQNVHVVPLFVEMARFDRDQASARTLMRLRNLGTPRMLSVSRVVPHKRVDDLLSLHAEVLRLYPKAQLFIVGGFAAGHASFRALKARADEMGGVHFLGRLSHWDLVAAYRAAEVYVSMSEHEGFGVPLIEAFASELPVLAFGAAAVPETMAGRGIVFDEKHFAALAEIVRLLQIDASLREHVVSGQLERAHALSFEATERALAHSLSTFIETHKRTQPRNRPRVAIVVQRYGEDIVGGAEAHARQIAERLVNDVDVEVLTTCATDHLSWSNELPPGVSNDGRILVHRFEVEKMRAMRAFNRLSDSVLGVPQDVVAEEHWISEQGPLAPGLLRAIVARSHEFDAFIFFTYLYLPAVWGIPLVKNKAIVVPTAHNELPIEFHLYSDVFETPRVLLCNTPEEEALIRHRFAGAVRSRVVGVGVEAPAVQPENFRDQFQIRGPYLLYLGRLDEGKGVNDLIAQHQELVKRFHDAPWLVLAGAGELKPRGSRVISVGRLDDQQKWDALSGAMAVAVPSRYESLSLVTLEAFAVGTPVIGNAACEVVAGQLHRSGGGTAIDFSVSSAFAEAVRNVGDNRHIMSERAKQYARSHQWENVISIYLEEIGLIQKDGVL